MKRIEWDLVAMGAVALAFLAGLVWLAVWIWTEHRGVLAFLAGLVVFGIVAAAAWSVVEEAGEDRRRAQAAAELRAREDRAAAEDANRSGLTPTAPAGWYPDPRGHGRERWWSGTAWEDDTRPVGPDL